MTKPKRVSKAAFDRWFTDTYGKPPTDAQLEKLHRARIRAEVGSAEARERAGVALELSLTYDSCYDAWLASQEAGNA